MTLTLKLDDEALSELKEALKISQKDFDSAWKTQAPDHAYRILRARRALDLSNSSQDCCFDYTGPKWEGVLPVGEKP